MTTMRETSMWRASVRGVDRDAVRCAVQRAGGIRSWDDPPREQYQLATATVEVFPDGTGLVLLINDSTSELVRQAAVWLGLSLDTLHVYELSGRRNS